MESGEAATALLPSLLGTLGTGVSESKTTTAVVGEEVGTLGTPFSQSRAYREEDMGTHMYKDWETGVPNVPSSPGGWRTRGQSGSLVAGQWDRHHGAEVQAATATSSRRHCGRLGRVFASPNTPLHRSDASDGVSEVQLQSVEVRTPRTGVLESNSGIAVIADLAIDDSRTPRTPFSNPRACTQEVLLERNNIVATLKEFEDPVRGVREQEAGEGCSNPPISGAGLARFGTGGTTAVPSQQTARDRCRKVWG